MNERRAMPRYNIALPITAGSLRGTTRTLGVSGVSFVAPSMLHVDESVDFSVHLSPEPNPLTMNCKGVVKRATRLKDGQFEIALSIDALDLDTGANS
jgi:hypothetical protein